MEDGILMNGIFGKHLTWSLPGQRGALTAEYLHTNRCAVIRDARKLVKIVPIDFLKSYVDAGLVSISIRE
jgi:hypothetical protein